LRLRADEEADSVAEAEVTRAWDGLRGVFSFCVLLPCVDCPGFFEDEYGEGGISTKTCDDDWRMVLLPFSTCGPGFRAEWVNGEEARSTYTCERRAESGVGFALEVLIVVAAFPSVAAGMMVVDGRDAPNQQKVASRFKFPRFIYAHHVSA
jgi:hypothetical protein